MDQFNAVECIAAHEAGTGREILEQLGRPADGWVAAVGTGCTFMGVARAMKAASAATVCAAVKLLQSGRLRADAVVATVLCDTGLKY